MSMIDIRYETSEVRQIKFAEDRSGFAGHNVDFYVESHDKGVKLTDSYDGEPYNICEEDIDNLIKALQKAKELWG